MALPALGSSCLFILQDGNITSVTQEIEGGADLELPTATSPPLRPLVLAFNYDHFQVMELLLTRGADPDGVEPQSHSSLLHLVASQGCLSVAALLLRHQADINTKVRTAAIATSNSLHRTSLGSQTASSPPFLYDDIIGWGGRVWSRLHSNFVLSPTEIGAH